jgi:hypothetical protein
VTIQIRRLRGVLLAGSSVVQRRNATVKTMNANDSEAIPRRETPIRAAASWDEVLFVCGKCVKRQNGERPSPPLRKRLKQALKTTVAGKRIRVVQCGCLDLCPKHGVTLARGSELGDAKKLRVVKNGDDPQMVVDWLLAADVSV